MTDMLRSARGKFRGILGLRARDDMSTGDPANKSRAELRAELETYKHAFETTTADRDRLAAELETYRYAFETTEADRDRLAAELEDHGHASEAAAERDRLAEELETYRQAFETTEAERDRLAEELETYRQAFETTEADRDRLAAELESHAHASETAVAELETYRQAFESTEEDRNIHKQEATDWKHAVAAFLDSDDFNGVLFGKSPRRDPPPQSLGPGLPNVFCVGVQKSATSFLFSVMRKHPKIAVYPKDIEALGRLHETGVLTEYTELSADIDITRPVIAQFEVGFIGNSAAGTETIKKYLCNNPKIIICIRDPVKRMISEYKMRVRTIRGNGSFVENYDFEQTLEMGQLRSTEDPGEYFRHFSYKENGQYSDKIEIYIKAFGRKNVHVIVMEEDLSQNACGAIAKLFDFLSLFDINGFQLSFLSHNSYREITRAPSEIEVIFHLADGGHLLNPAGMEDVAGKTVVRLEVRSNVPAQLDISHDDPRPELLASAIHLKRRLNYEPSRDEKKRLFNTYFRDDVARLERLLGRDLSVWYAGYDDAAGSMPRRRTS